MTSPRRRALLATAALLSGPAAAQTPSPQTPSPAPTPTTIPGLDDFSLPGTPGPTTTPTPESTVALPPIPSTTPAPSRTPLAVPRPSPIATPAQPLAPVSTPEPLPTVALPPAPVATPAPVAPAAEPVVERAGEGWPWWLGGAALAALAALFTARLLRRRGENAPEPERVEAAPVPAAPPPAPRARLAVDLHPVRAGLNLLSATVECEVTVTNTGDASAEAVRLGVKLFSAHTGQDAELAAFHAQPVARPAAPPFSLAPGETRRVRAVAALPNAEIRALEANGRSFFVPLVAANALYRAADGVDGQTAQTFAVGVEREGGGKLAPFRLDGPLTSSDRVAARPAAPAVAR